MPSIFDDIIQREDNPPSRGLFDDLVADEVGYETPDSESVPPIGIDIPSRFEDRPQRPLTLEDYNVTGPSRRPSSIPAPVVDDSQLRASEASDLGFEVPTPEDITEGEAYSDYAARERLNKNIRQASPFTMAQKLVVEPLRDVGAYTGNIGKGLATDIIQGNQDPSPYPLGNTRRAMLGVIPDEQQGVGGRTIQSVGQGAGQMAPALAAQAMGVPAPLAFGGTMAAEPLARGDIPGALVHGTLGAVLPGASSLGAQLGERAALNLAGRAALPEALLGPAQVAGKILGSQASMDALMVAASSPELIEEFKKDPAKAREQLAEIIGANLAFEGAHLPAKIREARAREAVDVFMGSPEYKRTIDSRAFESANVRRAPERPLRLADYEQARQARAVPQDVVKPVEPTPEPAKPVEAPKASVVEEAPPDLSMFKEAPTLQLTPVIKAGDRLFRGMGHKAITESAVDLVKSGDVEGGLALMEAAKNDANKGFVNETSPDQFVTRQDAQKLFKEATGVEQYYAEHGLSSEDLSSSQMLGHVAEAMEKAKGGTKTPPGETKAPIHETPTPVAETKPPVSETAPAKDLPAEGKIASVDDAGNVKVYKKSGRFFTQIDLEQAKAQGIPVPEKVPASRAEWIEGMGDAEHQRLFGKPKEPTGAEVEKVSIDTKPSTAEAPAESPAEAQSDVVVNGVEKAQEQVAEVAAKDGQRDATAIKDDLIAEIQDRLQKAPSEAVAGDKVTIEIPDDGTFTVPNTVEALSELLARAKRMPTNPGKVSGVPKKAIQNSAEAIRRMAKEPAKLAEPPPADPNAGAMHSGLGIVPPGFASVKAVTDAIQKVPAEFQAFRDNLAGKSAPRTSRASQESGNKLVQFAASKIAAPEVARSMATQVLGPHHRDAAFGQKLGAVLVEDRLRAIHDAFTQAGDAASAAAVETVVGKPWSPLATEAEFQAALADPEVMAAIDRHKATVQPEAQEAHEMARGELSGPGLNTGAFANLKAIGENIADPVGGGAARGNLENPLRRISKFFKQAKGNAAQYEIDYRTLAERMVEGNFQEAAKRRMYDQLVEDGLAVITDTGDPMPVIGKDKPIRFTIERRGTPMGEGRARTYIQNLWVRKDIAPELRQALDVDGAVGKAGLTTAAEIINRIQLAGPTDAVWHTANMFGSIAGSQGGKNVLVDLARKVPGVNLFDAIGRVTMRGLEVMKDSPEIQQQLAELARIGALRGKEHSGWAGRAINFVDKAGRLVRDDMYQNLVDRGLVKESEATRREWVNQMGQYNPRLMGQFQRFFRESGFSPFIVAGRNFNRMAMRRLAMSPGIEAASPAAALKLRAVEAAGLFTTLVVIPSLINYFLTGNPNGRPGTKFGQIDTGKDDGEGKNVVIDPAQWSGIRRGLRISGIGAAIEGVQHHESGKRITKNVARDILGGITHPWTGPAPRVASVGATGYDPSFYRQSVDPGDVGENVKAALHELNPTIGAAMEASKKDTHPAKELGYQLGGAVGLKRVSPYTEPRQLADKAREWLRKNQFKLAMDEPGYGTDYTRLRQAVRDGKEKTALDLMENLRYGKGELGGRSDATIAKAMQAYAKAPFTGSKEKERAFYDSLPDKDQALYDKAMEAKAAEFERFVTLWEKRPERTEP